MDSLRLPVLLLICTVRVVSLDKEIPAPEGERIESCAAGKISHYTQNQFFNAQLRKNNIFP